LDEYFGLTVSRDSYENNNHEKKFGMRIPAQKPEFKALIYHARSKRPSWTVRLNMNKNTILRHLSVGLICHAEGQ